MPQPCLAALRRQATEAQRNAEERYQGYCELRASGELLKRGGPGDKHDAGGGGDSGSSAAAASPEASPPGSPLPAVAYEREHEIFRLLNLWYCAQQEGCVNGVGGRDSGEMLAFVTQLAGSLREEFAHLQAGSVLHDDVSNALQPLLASKEILAYWHPRNPKVDGAVQLKDGRAVRYERAAFRIGDAALFSERLEADLRSGAPQVTRMVFHAGEGGGDDEEGEGGGVGGVVVYSENQDGDLLSFDATAAAMAKPRVMGLLKELGVEGGEPESVCRFFLSVEGQKGGKEMRVCACVCV